MKILVIALMIIFVSNYKLYSTNDYESNKIIIKFKSGYSVTNNWLSNNRTGTINKLIPLLGQHSSTGFLSNNFFIYSKSDNSLQANSWNFNLSRIAIINFENELNLDLIISKISQMEFIEYAEKMPIHHICGITNDPHVDYQYYIPRVRAHLAWGDINYMDTITVAVVDTGVEFTHPDLQANIFINQGETGLDKDGKDKSTNGIDDDNNGFIDDYHGWDFVPGDGSYGDNNPSPGHPHGTHVAGIIGAVTNNNIGIAGTAKNVKILPIKVGYDDQASTSTTREYEGIYYAAIMGAKIINCSWGGDTRSNAEEEVINTVTDMGSLIVGAAGNNYTNQYYYPAAYPKVLAVAAINEDNIKPDWSNYGDYVDVAAPGVNIWSTVPNKTYQFMKGTSMASPIVAAVASIAYLTHKDYNPIQLSELIKLTADTSIYADTINKYYIGTGCVDAYNIVNNKSVQSLILNNYKITDDNNDGIFTVDDNYFLSIELLNALSPVNNVKILVSVDDSVKSFVKFDLDTLLIDSMTSYQIINFKDAFTFHLTQLVPNDYLLNIKIDFFVNGKYLKKEFAQVFVNPSYINIEQNNISITANSIGNFAYNDFPDNTQGIGFKYKSSKSLLFEGSLMIGVGYEKVSDVARSYSKIKLKNFSANTVISDTIIENDKLFRAYTNYSDLKSDKSYGLLVRQYIFASDKIGEQDFIISEYNITNNSSTKMDSIYVGLFFDWDIGPSGANNIAIYDKSNHFTYIKNAYLDTLPIIGVKLLSNQTENYYGITNNGTQVGIFGIQDGFSKYEKWLSLSSGIKNDTTSISDISTVNSAGPFSLKPGQSTKVVFALIAGISYNDLVTTALKTHEFYPALGISPEYSNSNSNSNLILLFPNPAQETARIEFHLTRDVKNECKIQIIDVMGNIVKDIKEKLEYDEQSQEAVINFSTSDIVTGTYYVIISSGKSKKLKQLLIVR